MFYIKQLLHFTYEQALSCLFPVVIFLTLALSKLITIPGLYRYDFILIVCLLMQWFMYKTRLETKDELKVITVFHLIGLLLEIYKVHFGSWSYPEEAYSKVFGVPLYSGFMYASVASYICQAWRRMHLQMYHWPKAIFAIPLGAMIYFNFFTHHFIYDFRWVLTLLLFHRFLFAHLWNFHYEALHIKCHSFSPFSLSGSLFGLQRISQHFSEHGNIQINMKRGISFT